LKAKHKAKKAYKHEYRNKKYKFQNSMQIHDICHMGALAAERFHQKHFIKGKKLGVKNGKFL
jgi:hypothetical protein